MDLLSATSANADLLFSATIQPQSQLDELSSRALTTGIDLYMNKRYKEAAQEFQRAVGLSPQGQYASDASNYQANAYLKLGKTEKAIDAYEQSIRLNPYRDDTHVTLGNLYYSLNRFKDAEEQYKEAVRKNPSAVNHYSLGQAHLELDKYSQAEKEFNIVKRMAPEKANGDYGIGLSYSRQGRYEDAIQRFEQAIRKDRDLYDAYAEIGYAYADLGEMDQAQEIVDFLDKKSAGLADTLSRYMYKVDPPKFSLVYSTDFFHTQSMNTTVASLDAYLADPNASKTFTMKFVFDKEMDRESVENRFNWGIGRSTGSGPGEMYNFGLPVADTEIMPPGYPDHVYYDNQSLTAVVTFSLTQNEAANGTIDPSHIEFTFTGKDKFGYKMNPSGDQFRGFNGIA
ncbi:MAG: tetratricopeptide repeat protein [Desulfobacteraceae bacterium]|nr:tetratricopeptide repeat protein [Desulfobacteraceae bacterium]MBC2750821.1 tetratricopeptide repeat protein [Desulfobacteraceae bacterium]